MTPIRRFAVTLVQLLPGSEHDEHRAQLRRAFEGGLNSTFAGAPERVRKRALQLFPEDEMLVAEFEAAARDALARIDTG